MTQNDTHVIDRDIELRHNCMAAYWTSGAEIVSDLYLWKQYRALVLENERLTKEIEELTGLCDVADELADIMATVYAAPFPDPADFDEDEQHMAQMGTGRR